jgi:hypothetical protein
MFEEGAGPKDEEPGEKGAAKAGAEPAEAAPETRAGDAPQAKSKAKTKKPKKAE